MRQQNQSPREARQQKLPSDGVASTPASPSVAELVQLNKLGILSKSEIRELILRGTPSPSLPKSKKLVEGER